MDVASLMAAVIIDGRGVAAEVRRLRGPYTEMGYCFKGPDFVRLVKQLRGFHLRAGRAWRTREAPVDARWVTAAGHRRHPDRPGAMNNATGKRILALVREGDYAHPGEEEANALLFAGVRIDRSRVLDAGCGGGGAAWVRGTCLGTVTGIELDAATVRLARERHPEVTVRGDLQRAGDILAGPFDLVYSMTAIYAAPDQAAVFRELRALAARRRVTPARVRRPPRPIRGRRARERAFGRVAPARSARTAGVAGGRRLDRRERSTCTRSSCCGTGSSATASRSATPCTWSSVTTGTSSWRGSTPASSHWSGPATSAACSCGRRLA